MLSNKFLFFILNLYIMIFLPITCTRNISTLLESICPEFISFSEKESKSLTEEMQISNVNNMITSIQSDVQILGEGGFGKVISADFIIEKDMSPISVAVKFLRISDDKKTQNGRDDQDNLRREVQVNRFINSKDPNNLFFPRVGACFDMSLYFSNFLRENKGLIPDAQELLTVPRNKATMMISIEKLEISLFDILQKISVGSLPITPFFIRGKMGLYLLKAAALFNQKFYHCDIKPENLMLNTIPLNQIKTVIDNGLPLIKLSGLGMYYLKMIDFGLTAIYNEQTQTQFCEGGTPGFLGWEYFNSKLDQSKFDVFGIGMTLLNIEFVNDGWGMISSVFSLLFKITKKNFMLAHKQKPKETNLGQSLKNSLKNNYNVKRVLNYIDRSLFKQEIVLMFKDSDQSPLDEIYQLDSNFDIRSSKLSNFIFLSSEIFEKLFRATLSIYVNKYYLQKNNPLVNKYLTTSLQNINDQLSRTPRNKVLNGQQEYVTAKIALNLKLLEFRTQFTGFLLTMIENLPANRPTLEESLQMIEDLINNFASTNSEIIDTIESYEDEIPEERTENNMDDPRDFSNNLLNFQKVQNVLKTRKYEQINVII